MKATGSGLSPHAAKAIYMRIAPRRAAVLARRHLLGPFSGNDLIFPPPPAPLVQKQLFYAFVCVCARVAADAALVLP